MGKRLYLFDLVPVDWRTNVSIAKHAETEERESDGLREEDAADVGGDVGKGIADTADHEVWERGGLADERGLESGAGEVSLKNELIGKLDDCGVD